jgi:hyperosmotically inducible periplasmic protein
MKLVFLVAALLTAAPIPALADGSTDQQLEQAIKSSYTFRKVLNDGVEARVQNGVATLTGTVREAEQARLAADTVAGMEGVKRVENRIKVDPKARGGSDEWLAVKIRGWLLLKPDISVTRTDVRVKDGVVTITGVATSEAQKKQTEHYVREVAGVREVRNQIQVSDRPEARPDANRNVAGLPTGRDTAGEHPAVDAAQEEREILARRIEDLSITTEINFELLSNRATNGLRTTVDTRAGRVTITGDAQTQTEKDMVTRIAREIPGVVAVDNRMRVGGN